MLDTKVKLFVYGTLMKDFRNYDKYLKGHILSTKQAYTHGELYHLKHKNCPALVQGNDIVYGEAITFYNHDNLTLLQELDKMEEYFEGSPKVMYERRNIKIYYSDNKEEIAFAYIFIDKTILNENNSEYIQSGDWKNYILINSKKVVRL